MQKNANQRKRVRKSVILKRLDIEVLNQNTKGVRKSFIEKKIAKLLTPEN